MVKGKDEANMKEDGLMIRLYLGMLEGHLCLPPGFHRGN